MSLEKNHNIHESASIGEELLLGSPLSAMDRKCLTVRQVVHDGDFSLEEALAVYEVSRAEFDDFIAKYLISVLESSINPSTPEHLKMVISLEVFTNIYKRLFFKIDKDATSILEHLDILSKDVEQGKIRV
ncbi:hypothetical protein [Chitinophaga sp. sic0106]|uniref:hypothetical protein n=1 Tax=Chitinophaga sp. sic0106 TaxID=2854785 RepID=UPI001C467AF7|nr:hypothetical protein [Chitinophaga sp. sic0106]MBV7533132.1 hypothetical protein [Chitinophaga sp. sic0106]